MITLSILPQILDPRNAGDPDLVQSVKHFSTVELLEEISERAELQAAFWRDVAALAKVELAQLELGKAPTK